MKGYKMNKSNNEKPYFEFKVYNKENCLIALMRDEEEVEEFRERGLIKDTDKIVENHEEIYTLQGLK